MSSSLRFDGLYVSNLLDGGYRSYLRFLSDGQVFSASVAEPSKPEQVWTWLGTYGYTSPSGRYTEDGSTLSFETVLLGSVDYRDGSETPDIRVEYSGSILGDGSLSLDCHSHATGYRATETYEFRLVESS